ncbi:MAG: hypothetical protein AAFR39_06445 [Pseudomonadota bacterium]
MRLILREECVLINNKFSITRRLTDKLTKIFGWPNVGIDQGSEEKAFTNWKTYKPPSHPSDQAPGINGFTRKRLTSITDNNGIPDKDL